MNAELIFFGKRVDMAPRHRRRTLVILLYASLALLMAACWFLTHWRGTGAYVFFAALIACRLFLGGYYPGGLVKPFNGKVPHRSEMPPSLLALKLHVYHPVLAADEASYRSDERELSQHDHAHYLAYQAIIFPVLLVWLLASFRIANPAIIAWLPMPPDAIYYGLSLIAVTMFLTLPQAVLLWTEPDMDSDL